MSEFEEVLLFGDDENEKRKDISISMTVRLPREILENAFKIYGETNKDMKAFINALPLEMVGIVRANTAHH